MIDASLLHDFIAETGEHLEELENNLLELEAAPGNRSLLNEVFRSIHTIKGASEYLGMTRIAQLSHTLESLLEILRQGSRVPDQSLIDIIIDARDRIAMLVQDIEKDKEEKTTIDDLIERMEALQSAPADRPPHGDVSAPPASSQPDPLQEVSFPELSFMDEAIEPTPSATAGDDPNPVDADGGTAPGGTAPSGEAPGAAAEADAPACPDTGEEEYDEELFEIFIDHLRENLGRIRDMIDAAEPASPMVDILQGCLPAVSALHSSANYMDYETIANIHSTWQCQIENAIEALEQGAPVVFQTPDGMESDPVSGMNAYIDALVRHFPRLADLRTEGRGAPADNATDDTAAPLTESPPAATAPAGNFKGLFDELDSVFAGPAPEAAEPPELENIFEDDQAAVEARLAALSSNATPDGPSDAAPSSPSDSSISEAPEARAGVRGDDASGEVELQAPSQEDADRPAAPGPEKGARKSPPLKPAAPPELQLVPPIEPPSPGLSSEEHSDGPAEPAAETAAAAEPPPIIDTPIEKAVKQSIRVDASKIDALMNQVGELVVSRAWFSQLHQEMRLLQDHLKEKVGLEQREMKPVKALTFRISEAIVALSRASNELQEGVMKVRMLPIAQLFNRYPRLVRDLVHDAPKQVHLEIIGAETELDKMVIEEISDPLIHLIRNAVDHGCETISERLAAGKPEECRLVLHAYHESNHVVIEIADDGRGIDPELVRQTALRRGIAAPEELDRMSRRELLEVIMKPGFSTAREVTKVSGRGVGMDVVRKNVEKLAGSIEIDSRVGEGTRFRIKIPLTLAIIQALLVRVGEEIFTIPLTAVEETLRIFQEDITTIEGVECIYLRNSTLSLLRLSHLFNIPSASTDLQKGFVVVVNTGMRRVGLVVDALIGQEETVIKPLVDYLQESSGFSGATILGDGRISLILDVHELIKLSIGSHRRTKHRRSMPAHDEGGMGQPSHVASAARLC